MIRWRFAMAQLLLLAAMGASVGIATVARADPVQPSDPSSSAEPTRPASLPNPSLPQLPSPGPAPSGVSTGGIACVDGVKTPIPPQGLEFTGYAPHVEPYFGQC